MKKVLSIVLAFAAMLSLLSFAGCSDGSEDITSAYQEKISSLEEQITELQTRNDDLESIIKELQEQGEDIKSVIKELQANKDSLDAAMQELQNTTQLLEQQNKYIKREYEKILLTVSNYEKYLSVNVSFSDFVLEYLGTDSLNTRHYNLLCIANISTQRKVDCYFENVTIYYDKINVLSWNSESTLPSTKIGYEGTSLVSTLLWQENTLFVDFPSTYNKIEVSAISGFVLVPKEA